MRNRRSLAAAALGATAAVMVLAGARVAPPAAGPRPLVETATPRVHRYAVFEHTFKRSSAGLSNPWEQVGLTMTLTSPKGQRITVGGFYYGPDTWKARFAPDQLGTWSWAASFEGRGGGQTFRGRFKVVRRGGGHGFVRRSPYNPFRWIFSDGSPYYPIGIGDCIGRNQETRSPFQDWGLDSGRADINTYLAAYQRAGVNLFRWSIDNCAFSLFRTIDPAGNVYLAQEGAWGDELAQDLRRHGFRIYMTIFGHDPDPPFTSDPTDAQLQAVDRYVKYVADRYGAYVDFWELMNESTASAKWYTQVASYLRSVDPYHHPIATSWERPDLPVIDVNSPHWYQTEDQFQSDRITWGQVYDWKAAGKPVIVGEQGNTGQNWDPESSLRMRLRAWTAFFAEATLIFWNTSYSRDYHSSAGNIYLGPEERGYLGVLQRFTRGFDKRAQMVAVAVSPDNEVRGYGLNGPAQYAAYLHAYTDHTSQTVGVRVTVDIPRAGTATWISPTSGSVLGRVTLRHRGAQTLRVPPFVTDVALKINYAPRR